jgi:cytochrome c553
LRPGVARNFHPRWRRPRLRSRRWRRRKQADEACAGCHGPGGNSEIPEVPSLAGQQSRYIILALFQFRAGHRKSEQIAPFAAGLTDEDLGNLLPITARRNRCRLARLSTRRRPQRRAGSLTSPNLLKQQLLEFKAGTRGDIDGNMTSAALPLSDADVDTLARYAASLFAPGG